MIFKINVTQGHNSIKYVDLVMVLNLYTSSDCPYICCKFSRKYLKGF